MFATNRVEDVQMEEEAKKPTVTEQNTVAGDSEEIPAATAEQKKAAL